MWKITNYKTISKLVTAARLQMSNFICIFEHRLKNTHIMKQITQNERPIGRGYTGYDCFYSEDIVKETEKAFLVAIYFDRLGEKANRWLPKSKMLVYNHIDNREIIDDGKNFFKNPNYGKERAQYFISSFFTKDKGADFRYEPEDIIERQSDHDVMGVKGIDY